MTHRLSLLFFLSLFAAAWPLHAQSVNAILQDQVIVTRERVTLTVYLSGADAAQWPRRPRVAPLTLKQQGQPRRTIINGRRAQAFQYEVSCIQTGTFTIPAIEVITRRGQILRTQPLTLQVFDENELQRNVIKLNATSHLPYYTGIFFTQITPYSGQAQPVTMKVYLPRKVRVQEPSLANLETQNLAAWRFEANRGGGTYDRDQLSYQSLSYSSTFSGLRPGRAALGPGKVEPIIEFRASMNGRIVWRRGRIQCLFSEKKFNVRPLPQPAPPTFDGAVGDFAITSLPKAQEIRLGESLTVDLRVTGTGNLNNLSSPTMEDPDGQWKKFEPVKAQLGTERRDAEGTSVFNQIVRPLTILDQLPAYTLTFFDPLLEQYRTVRSAPYPLTILPGKAPATVSSSEGTAEGPAFLTGPGVLLTSPGLWSRYPWLWQIVPACLLLTLLCIRFYQLRKQRLQRIAPLRQFQKELQQLQKFHLPERPAFYRELGKFLDRWPHPTIRSEAEEWLKIRDELCFRPDSSEPEKILPKERQRILGLLQTIAPAFIATLFFSISSPAEGRDLPQLWQEKKWSEAIELLEKKTSEAPTSTHFYNLGLVYQQADQPGPAALNFYRALAAEPGLDRTPLEKMTGSLSAPRLSPTGQGDWLTRFPRSTYHQIFQGGLWLLVLAGTLGLLRPLPALRRTPALILFLIGFLLSIFGGTASFFYPEHPEKGPLLSAAVLQSADTLREAPAKTSPALRELPPSSLIYPGITRGPWTQVSLPDGRQGWLLTESFEPILPPTSSASGDSSSDS